MKRSSFNRLKKRLGYLRSNLLFSGDLSWVNQRIQQVKACLGFLLSYLLKPINSLLSTLGIQLFSIETRCIGALALDTDYFIKKMIVQRKRRWRTVMILPANASLNRHLLQYWRRHVDFICHQSPLRFFLKPLAMEPGIYRDGEDYADIEEAYLSKDPLLTLTQEDKAKGWDCLGKLGVPKGSWFVSVHSRAPYFWSHSQMENAYRDAEIGNYFLMFEEIARRGGWVIRVGEPTRKALPSMEGVIDYANSPFKSDWMDIFLCAGCRLFVGCNSGLKHVSQVFGVPFVSVNMAPLGMFPLSDLEIAIPKLMRLEEENRLLSFEEVFDGALAMFQKSSSFNKAGIFLVDNSQDEIRDVVIEMLDRFDGIVNCSEEDERLQEQYKALVKPDHYGYGGRGRIGAKFLRKYRHLLMQENQKAGSQTVIS